MKVNGFSVNLIMSWCLCEHKKGSKEEKIYRDNNMMSYHTFRKTVKFKNLCKYIKNVGTPVVPKGGLARFACCRLRCRGNTFFVDNMSCIT
jgi:hypothetical protein